MFAFIILTSAIAALVWLALYTWMVRRSLSAFPGPATRFLMNAHQFGPDKVQAVVDTSTEFLGQVFKVYLAPWIPWLVFSDPKHMRLILKTNEPKMYDAYYPLSPWLGEGLLLANGKKWSRNRRLLTPGFHFEILKPYLGIATEASDILVDVLSKHASTGQWFNIMPAISRCTLDVLLRCSMTAETHCQTETRDDPYVAAVEEVSVLTMDRIMVIPYRYEFIFNTFGPGKKFSRALEIMHAMSAKVIADRREALQTSDGSGQVNGGGKRRYLDFLDILLTARDEAGNGLTDKEIRDEVDTFMFEGHDTTAHGIGWTLYCLGLHKEHQQKCRQEVDEVMGNGDGDLTWDDMPQLKYLHMCIRESMRLYPPVPVIGRKLTTDMDIEGKVAPAGTAAFCNIMALHRNPEVYDNPLEYRPSRFTEEEMKKRDPFAYVPFSAGPRNCIGQIFASHEMKIMVAKILREYEVETDPDHTLELRFALVLRPMNGLQIRLRRRADRH